MTDTSSLHVSILDRDCGRSGRKKPGPLSPRRKKEKKKVYVYARNAESVVAPIQSKVGLLRSFPLFKLKNGVRLGRQPVTPPLQRLISHEWMEETAGGAFHMTTKGTERSLRRSWPMSCRKKK